MVAIPIPAQPDAIELGTGPLPGATAPESWHSQYGSKFARNVTVATLRPFLPDPAKATGAAVIVAPGGGFRTLSMENEGWNVARALAERGVAAFVLKYRLNQTPADLEEFARPPAPRPTPAPGGAPPAPRPAPGDMAARLAPQIADANAAFALVRANATEVACRPRPHRHDRVLRRRGAHHGDHPQQPGRQTGFHRQHLRPPVRGRLSRPTRRLSSRRLPPTIRCFPSTSA